MIDEKSSSNDDAISNEVIAMAEMEKPIPNRRLRFERERRGWSQQDVADKVGTTPLNVGRWERGVTVPGPHFRLKLSEIFEKSPPALGLVADRPTDAKSPEPASVQSTASISAEPQAPLWNVPYRRNGFFTGREDVLLQLHIALTGQTQPVALSQPQAISGLGGVGKTQTAVEYAHRYRDDYATVLWARAESADLLTSDYLTIAALLELPERSQQDQRPVVKAVLRWFDTHEGWLLILDNADDLEMASAFIPSSSKGYVLLTTRAYSTGTIAGRIELDTMTVEEGMLFLLRRIKRIRSNAQLESVPESIRVQARSIVEEMDALPLALDQAGAYIEETGTSLSDYLKLYRARRHRLLRMRGQDAAGHPEPVATTWSLSVEKIKQANPAAAEMLYLLALLHPDRIPESMIVEGASELGPVLQSVVSDEFDFNEALGELHKYSLIKRDPEEKILAIHRLVQAVIWDRMSEQERELWSERAIAALDVVFPEVRTDTAHEVWERSEHLLPHVLVCAAAIVAQQHCLALASVLFKAAEYLYERGQYEQTEQLYLRSLYIREQTLGPEHPQIANSLYGLAALYQRLGKYEQAESLFQRVLQLREQTLGPEHPQVATSLHGLATLFYHQGKYEQAELLFQRSLQLREQNLGREHPQVAISLNNLGGLYYQTGKYEQAEPLYQRALHIVKQTLGSDHPLVAYTLSNLAEVYCIQGKYAEAESLNQRALTTLESVLGTEHPITALHLNNLADFYHLQGMNEQAELLYKRSLLVLEHALGLEHCDVAYPLNGLANVYREQGKDMQAEPFYRRALTIRQLQRGAQHPETAESLHDFARFHEVRQQPEEALSLYQQALAIREQQLGSQHPHTLDTRNRTARLLREMGRTEEAAALETSDK
jgi:tetratricopeptide (TPR) repeat protein/transcriptional regulator with XRE-family HTH domain